MFMCNYNIITIKFNIMKNVLLLDHTNYKSTWHTDFELTDIDQLICYINPRKYFDNKVNYELFDKIIAAFKVRGKQVEIDRTSHDKTMDDFVRCTKLSENIEVCFIDDLYHSGMVDDKVYYINVKPYKYQINIEKINIY